MQPDNTPLICQIGFTWSREFQYWADKAQTEAYDFTGWDITFQIEHQNGTTTSATVDVDGGSVLATLGATVTAAFRPQTAHYLITMTNSTDPDESYPLGEGYFGIVPVDA